MSTVTRTRVRWGRAAALGAVVVLGVSSLGGRAGAGAAHPKTGRVYVVRPGDTLWGIAASLVGREGDPRPVVDRLARLNGISDGLIAPGQRLMVRP